MRRKSSAFGIKVELGMNGLPGQDRVPCSSPFEVQVISQPGKAIKNFFVGRLDNVKICEHVHCPVRICP